MYLQLISDRPLDPTDEQVLIETSFSQSPFRLIKPLKKNPRGGFDVDIDCNLEDCDAVVKLLVENNLRGLI